MTANFLAEAGGVRDGLRTFVVIHSSTLPGLARDLIVTSSLSEGLDYPDECTQCCEKIRWK
jgi:hypothetical protein